MLKKKTLILLAFIVFALISTNVYAADEENKETEEFKTTTASEPQEPKSNTEQNELTAMPNINQKKAFTVKATASNGYTYTELSDGTIEITGYTGTATALTIPSTIDGKKVTSIGDYALRSNKIITSLTVPNTVTKIGIYSVANCTLLETVTLADSVESIGNWSFANNPKLSKIDLGNNLKIIGAYAFEKDTNLTNINIPNTVEEIQTYAFTKSGITSIVLPKNLATLGASVFSDCNNLQNISIASGNTNFTIIDNVIYNKDQTVLVYYFPLKRETSYTMPNTVRELPDEVFANVTNLKNITLSSSLEKIGRYTFRNSGITSIEFPETVSEVGRGAFMECASLESVTLRGTFKGISYWMFQDCTSLSEVIFDACNDLYSFSNNAFENCDSLVSITLPETTTIVGAYCFAECDNLTTVVFNENIELIEAGWNDDSPKLTNFKIPEGLTLLENGDYSKVVTITIDYPTNVYSYGEAWEVLDLLNQYRKEQGLNELTMDTQLLEDAMLRAQEISVLMEHTRPNGLDCFTAITEDAVYVAENIAGGQSTPEAVIERWKTSSGHNANMISSRYNSVGIGCYITNSTHYWVQIFSSNEGKEPARSNEQIHKTVTQQVAYGLFNDIGVTEYYNENTGKDIYVVDTEETIEVKKGDVLTPYTAWIGNMGWTGRLSFFATTDATWKSSNENVLKVSNDGTITFVGTGTAQVIMTLGNVTRTYTFRADTEITGISLDKTNITLEEGKTQKLIATITPNDATQDKKITWTSGNTSVATVDEDGVVTAKRAGTVTITATTTNGLSATCRVSVIEPKPQEIPITGITLDKTNITLEKGKTENLKATVAPSNTTQDKTVTWSSENTKIATVKDGVVTAVAEGTTKITVTTVNGKTATCKVTVTEPQTEPEPEPEPEPSTEPGVTYLGHVQELGWETEWLKDGETSGVENQGLKVEAFYIKLTNASANAHIQYRTHVQDLGWEEDWAQDGAKTGTTGKNKKVEAIQIKLKGLDGYSVEYRSYVTGQGWLDWVSDGVISGTTGQNLKLEAVQIRIVKTDEKVPVRPGVTYRGHVQDIGDYVTSGKTSGVEGKGLKVEAFNIRLTNVDENAHIKYETHVQDLGWESEKGQGIKADGAQTGTTGKNKKVEAIRIKLENMPDYSVEYRAYVAGQGWQQWVKDGEDAGTTGKNLKLEAVQIRIVPKSQSASKPGLIYKGHIQELGWEEEWTQEGETSGLVGEGLKVEAFNIKLTNTNSNAHIKYETHVQDYGWERDWKEELPQDGEETGTTGKNKKVEAIRIWLEGLEGYSVEYRSYVTGQGWLDWVSDGVISGTTGQNLKLEAVQIRIVKSEEKVPIIPGVTYRGHVQDIGWQEYVKDGATSGVEGKGLKVEAFNIRLTNVDENAHIKYETHVQDLGWESEKGQGIKADGAQTGTTGKNKKVEAIRIWLEGIEGYSVEYRAYVAGQGWQQWVRDGEDAGTTGKNLKLEAIQIRIVKK